jgi:Fe2+ transport system protein B
MLLFSSSEINKLDLTVSTLNSISAALSETLGIDWLLTWQIQGGLCAKRVVIGTISVIGVKSWWITLVKVGARYATRRS